MTVNNGTLIANAEKKGYIKEKLLVKSLNVLGVLSSPSTVTVNGQQASYKYSANKVSHHAVNQFSYPKLV